MAFCTRGPLRSPPQPTELPGLECGACQGTTRLQASASGCPPPIQMLSDQREPSILTELTPRPGPSAHGWSWHDFLPHTKDSWPPLGFDLACGTQRAGPGSSSLQWLD